MKVSSEALNEKIENISASLIKSGMCEKEKDHYFHWDIFEVKGMYDNLYILRENFFDYSDGDGQTQFEIYQSKSEALDDFAERMSIRSKMIMKQEAKEEAEKQDQEEKPIPHNKKDYMLSIEEAEADYTGGGIYVFLGKASDGVWFLGSDSNGYEVSFVNSDPRECFDDTFYPEWIEAHKISEECDTKAALAWYMLLFQFLKENDDSYDADSSIRELAKDMAKAEIEEDEYNHYYD